MTLAAAIFLLAVIPMIVPLNVQAELKFLNVVFRHGDRAPDNNGLEVYPNDPYRYSTFDHVGLGGLTNKGKMRSYTLGTYLRKQYGDFLGDIYRASEVSARSTDSDRTKMSLQLVLAGLYPPKKSQKWHTFLNWQPITFTYVPSLDDTLMVPEQCPKYLRAREKAEASEEYRKKLKIFKPMMKQLTVQTGKPITNSNDLYYLWFDLMSEHSMNLKLPNWVHEIFPTGQLLDGINLEYDIANFNNELKRLNGGMLLRKIIDEMILYTERDDNIKNQKIKLYSGHETNIAALLQALGVYTPHPPAFSSAVFIELHKNNGVFSVKVKYYKGIPSEEVEMSIKGCGSPCTLKHFMKTLKKVLPSDEDLKCDKRSLAAEIENNEIDLAIGIIKPIKDALVAENTLRGILQK